MLQRIIRVKQLKRVTTVFEIGMLTFLRNSPCARTGGGGGAHSRSFQKGNYYNQSNFYLSDMPIKIQKKMYI